MRSTAEEVNDFVWFVLNKEYVNQASSSFTVDYVDREGIRRVFKDETRGGAPKRFYFSRRSRKLRFHKNQKELIELIENHPECQNSPNGLYRVNPETGQRIHLNARFRKIDEEGDAQVSISQSKMLNDAMNKAFEIYEDVDLMNDVALVLGIKKSSDDLTFDNILVYVDRDPKGFLEVANSKELKARALAQKAMDASIFTRNSKGHLMLGDFDYGMDKEDVIQTLLEDVDKRMFLKRKFGIRPSEDDPTSETNQASKKKSPGRPKKSE